jgi:hypothetical protein
MDADYEHVHWKDGAPGCCLCPLYEVELQAGETVERTTPFHFGTLYSVDPGDYPVAFRYDLRLFMPPNAVQRSWVPWSNARLRVKVK